MINSTKNRLLLMNGKLFRVSDNDYKDEFRIETTDANEIKIVYSSYLGYSQTIGDVVFADDGLLIYRDYAGIKMTGLIKYSNIIFI